MPESEGRTLSEADIAAAVESAPSVPSTPAEDADAAIADVAALVSGAPDPDEAGDGAGDEPSEQGGESPAGEPGGQAKPDAKPADDGKPAEKGEVPAVVPVWDPERQRRDQERANQDKAKNRTLADKEREIADLKAQLAAKPAEKPAEKDAKAEVNLKSLKDKVKALTTSDEATTEDWAGVFNATIEEMERLASRNQDSSEVAELKARLESMESRRVETERDAGLKAAQKQVLDEMETLDKKYHPQMRNDAVALANQMLKDEGHSEDSPATASEWKLALKAAYAEVAGKHPELLAAKPARKAAPRQAVRPDPGTGGGHQAAPRTGRIDDVVADMLKSGKFR